MLILNLIKRLIIKHSVILSWLFLSLSLVQWFSAFLFLLPVLGTKYYLKLFGLDSSLRVLTVTYQYVEN